MKVFHCDRCDALVFFENVRCVSCGYALAFLPDLGAIAALALDDSGGYRQVGTSATDARRYRLCRNYIEHNVCNWAVEGGDETELCRSCRLTSVIPNLSDPKNKLDWSKLETAKRRLVYTLMMLNLPLSTKQQDPAHGLTFEFKAPGFEPDAQPVLTGHTNGVITINTTEARDAERERVREQLHEPYRTLIGHFRHEIGHYYWDRLIAGSERLERFRTTFGDEQQDYSESLQRHYANGPPADWQQRCVSAYSTAHPWEDWAETFAHYLHMYDTLDTAAACGLMLKPSRSDEPTLESPPAKPEHARFDQMLADWFPLTYALNNLYRGLGQMDAYPFVLSRTAIEKLQFVHEVVRENASRLPAGQQAAGVLLTPSASPRPSPAPSPPPC